jgi:hypothetical protein
MTSSNDTIPTPGTLTADTLWLLLRQCPPEAIKWASVGWRVGVVDGRRDVLARIGQAGQAVRLAAGRDLHRPRWDELAGRREIDHQPCPTKCRKCARCLHSLAYYGRGGRDYLGVQAEAELAGASS